MGDGRLTLDHCNGRDKEDRPGADAKGVQSDAEQSKDIAAKEEQGKAGQSDRQSHFSRYPLSLDCRVIFRQGQKGRDNEKRGKDHEYFKENIDE